MRSMNIHDSGFSEYSGNSAFRRLPSYKSTMRRQRMVTMINKTKEFSMASPMYQSTPKRTVHRNPSQRRSMSQRMNSQPNFEQEDEEVIESCRNYDQVPDCFYENQMNFTPSHVYENCFNRYLEEDARYNNTSIGDIDKQCINESYHADKSLRDADELIDLMMFREELEKKKTVNIRRVPTNRAPVRFIQSNNNRRSIRIKNGRTIRRAQVNVNLNTTNEPRKPRKKLTFGTFLAETGMDILKSVKGFFGRKNKK